MNDSTEQTDTTATQADDLNTYLKAVFPDGSGTLHWATNIPGSRNKSDWMENPARWPAISDTIAAQMIREAQRYDVYVCPYLGSTRKRTKGKAAARWVIHADIDGDLDVDKVTKLGGFAIASGTPGHAHVYVPLADSISDPKEHERLCRRLGAVFEGCDVAKCSDNDVLRPPGTLNHKPTLDGGEPTPVKWLVPFDGSRVDAGTLERLLGSMTPVGDPTRNGHEVIDASDIDLSRYPAVRKAVDEVTRPPDRSKDTMRIVGACYDARLTLAQARSVVGTRADLSGRLDERDDDDVLTCWLKIDDDRRSHIRAEQPVRAADQAAETTQYGDPKQYFEKDGLQVRDLADDVMATITVGYGANDGRLYVYEHGLWVPDDGRIQAEIAARLGNRYRKMHSSNVLDMIKYTPGILRITCDPVPDYVNVRNGMVDWRKEKLLPHDPKYCSTVQLPVTYDPNANCPEFDQFLADVLPADCIAFMWELIAYTIYSGNPFHIAVMLYGKGRNGKGTLMRVLKALLGARNTSSVTLYELMDNRFRSATLYGKLANLAGDLDGRWLDNTAIFKALTGGDTIQGEIKHGAIFDFSPWALPFYSMNKPFSSADSSEGWWARWIVVPFPNSFVGKENRTLDNVLQTDAELSGILTHALRVLPALMKRGRLSEPESVRQAKKGFIASSDTLRHFVSENCELDPNAWTERGNLYRAYSRHAAENGAKQMSNREFYNRIEQIGGVSEKRKTDGRGFQGIKLIGQPLGGEPLVP